MRDLSCFKAYDIRGDLDLGFDDEVCFLIARAFADILNAKTVVAVAANKGVDI